MPRCEFVMGHFELLGVPNARMKGLSGNVEDGRSAIAATARRMSLSLTSQDGDDFCPMAGSESAHSCRSV